MHSELNLFDNEFDINEISLEVLQTLSTYFYDYVIDNIEDKKARGKKVRFILSDGEIRKLRPSNFVSNSIFWMALKQIGVKISKKHIFKGDWTEGAINDYIDKYVVTPHISKIDKAELNLLCSMIQESFTKIADELGMVVGATIDLHSDVHLLNSSPVYEDLIYNTLPDNVSLDQTEEYLMGKLGLIINEIKETDDHCLVPYINAKQGVSPAQMKEYYAAVGTKPDGMGGIFPMAVKDSFVQGISTVSGHFIESTKGRIAQIMSKNNVGTTGDLARKFNLLNRDTCLHPDEDFECETKNFIKVEVRDIIDATYIRLRYARFSFSADDFLITDDILESLVGQTIYLRSPQHCASEKVCRKCYGELYFLNRDIVAGQYSASQCTNSITQLMLSAKHVLKSNAAKINFPGDVDHLFKFQANILVAGNFKGFAILIETSEIEFTDMGAKIQVINIVDEATGETYSIDVGDNMIFVAQELLGQIEDSTETIVPHEDMEMFYIEFKNNELSELFNKVNGLINKNDVGNKTIEEFYAAGRDIVCRELRIPTIHFEMATRMMTRSTKDILKLPDWRVPNNKNYELIRLDKAVIMYPSISVSLSFQSLKKQLFSPVSFRKAYPSLLDSFFAD